jgi:hypothetical protein
VGYFPRSALSQSHQFTSAFRLWEPTLQVEFRVKVNMSGRRLLRKFEKICGRDLKEGVDFGYRHILNFATVRVNMSGCRLLRKFEKICGRDLKEGLDFGYRHISNFALFAKLGEWSCPHRILKLSFRLPSVGPVRRLCVA